MKKRVLLVIAMVLIAALVVSCASSAPAKADAKKTDAAAADKPIKLKAQKAKLVSGGGEGIRMEDGGNVGYWGNLNDQIVWTLEIPEDGDYVVSVQYSVAENFANATVKVTVGDQVLPDWTVVSTGTWGSYKNVDLGTLTLKAGSYPVTMQATAIANRFVANTKYLLFTKK